MTTKTVIETLAVTIVAAISSIVTIMATARVLGPLPISLSQTIAQKQSTFDVTGESEITTVPDNAEVTLGIEIRQNTIASAQDQANKTINAVRDELAKIGIAKEHIRTENYSIYPEYDFTNPSRRIIGYNVNTSLRVSVKEFENMNTVIDSATRAGANQVGGIQFTLSDEKEKEIKKQAREEAIQKAKQNAQELAGLAGMKLGKIVNVVETPANQPVPMYLKNAVAEDAAMGGSAEPTQIEPGSTKYTYSVRLSYETL